MSYEILTLVSVLRPVLRLFFLRHELVIFPESEAEQAGASDRVGPELRDHGRLAIDRIVRWLEVEQEMIDGY